MEPRPVRAKHLSRFGRTEQGMKRMQEIKDNLGSMIGAILKGKAEKKNVERLEIYNEMDEQLRKAHEIAKAKYRK